MGIKFEIVVYLACNIVILSVEHNIFANFGC